MPNPKVLVCQRGARHRYAVPKLLNEAGLLAALYTDSCRYTALGRMADFLVGLGVKQRSVKALSARDPKGIEREKIFSSDRLTVPPVFCGLDTLAPVYKGWNRNCPDVVYSMYGEELDFLEWVKARGAKIIIDVFVHPRTNRIVAEEEIRLLGRASEAMIDREDAHSERAFQLADVLLCPSQWVAEGVREFSHACSHKIRVLPYGSSVGIAQTINTPRPGTILFAGREPLRKGVHYLAEAAYLLRKEGMELDVRVAGVKQNQIGWMAHRSELNCLGTVPMEQMKKEYRQADLFVLPSLSEGQAGVLLEAMASGIPVVATRESGVDFDPGCGITVPARNASALAESIKSIVENREVRTRFAEGSLRQASVFSMEAWKGRLVRIIEEVS